MKKLVLSVAVIIFITGCGAGINSFRKIDTTDVIPTKEQVKEQLAAEKEKEKKYLAGKTGYPDTTKTVTPEPVKTASTTPATNPVVTASATKKPVREIVIYPDDNIPQPKTDASTTVTASQAVQPKTAEPEPVAETVVYRVLVGKFPTKESVAPLLSELKETYKTAFIRKAEGKEEYSVQIAASANEKSAKDMEAKLKKQGYKVFILEGKK